MPTEEDDLRRLRDLRSQIARVRRRIDARVRSQRGVVHVADFWRHPGAALTAALAMGVSTALRSKHPGRNVRGWLRLLRRMLGPIVPAVWQWFDSWRAKRAAPSPEPVQPEHGQ